MQPDELEIRYAATVEENPTAGDTPRARTISAQLTTYGQTVHPQSSWGMPVRLLDAALETPQTLNDVKLLRDHDPTRVVGAMTAVEQTETGPRGTFRLARTAAADEAFALAQDGIIDSVSVGYRVHDYAFAEEDGQEIVEVSRASLREVSLVGAPADSTARIDSVTARKARAMTTSPAVEPVLPEQLTPQQLDQVLAHVRDHQAPAAAAPIAPPAVVSARLVDPHGRPIVLAHDRIDQRIPGVYGTDGKRYTAGDYFVAYAQGINRNVWGPYEEIRAALADELTSDVPGLLPKSIVGELIGRANGRRPVWDSLTARAMPMEGEKFSRPRITQHVKVDPQTAQKTQVATQKFTVALDDVTKTTLAGALDIAQQAIDWTSPALLNELIVDFTRIAMARTDKFAADALIAAQAVGAQSVAWDGTAATLTKALAEAAGKVYAGADSTTDVFPNTIWLSVDVWVLIAGLVDTTGRPLLPQLGATNATGTVDLSNPEGGVQGPGFRWVIDKNLPPQTMIMGDSTFTESYENGQQFLRAVRPDVLGLDLAHMLYVASYFPYPKTLVKITVPAPTPPPGVTTAASK